MFRCIDSLVEMAHSSKVEFNRLDGLQGDGDLGVTVELMASAIHSAAEQYGNDLKIVLTDGGTRVRKQAPSTMGILVSFAMIAAGRELKDDTPLDVDAFVTIQKAMITEIKRRGEAELGDRTVLDALIPAFENYQKSVMKGAPIVESLRSAVIGAKQGAEATRGMVPKTGRASWVGQRSMGEVDGGAWLCYKVYQTLLDSIDVG